MVSILHKKVFKLIIVYFLYLFFYQKVLKLIIAQYFEINQIKLLLNIIYHKKYQN